MEKTRDGGKPKKVVEGTYSLKTMDRPTPVRLESKQRQKSTQEMYDRIFNMKFLPLVVVYAVNTNN